jgi:hypothetical protein
MQILGISIDLSKLDKSKIKEGKNSAKYYDLTVIISDEPNQYGKDVSVIEPQTKEERTAKAAKTYLGNGKVLYTSTQKSPANEPVKVEGEWKHPDKEIDPLPF